MGKQTMIGAASLMLALNAAAFELPNVAAPLPIIETERDAEAAIGRNVALEPGQVAAALQVVDMPWIRAYVASDYSDNIEPGIAVLHQQGGVWSVAALEPNLTLTKLQALGAPESLDFSKQPAFLASTPDWELDTTQRTYVGRVYALRYPNPATLWVVSPEEIAILGPRMTPSGEDSEMHDGKVAGPEGDPIQQAAAEPAYIVRARVYPNPEEYDAQAYLMAEQPDLARMARPVNVAGDIVGVTAEAAPHGVRMRVVFVPAGQSMVCVAYPLEDVRDPAMQAGVGEAVAMSLRPLAMTPGD